MGVAIDLVFSMVQSNIGDDAMDRLHIGHYVDLANRVASVIATETECWIGRYIATPVNDLYTWNKTFKYTKGQIVEFNSLFYIAINENQNSDPTVVTNDWVLCPEWNNTMAVTQGQYIRYSGIIYQAIRNTSNEPPNDDYSVVSEIMTTTTQVILPYKIQQELIAPYKIISVSRYNGQSFQDTVEYSMQSIIRTQMGNQSFRINQTYLGDGSFYSTFKNKVGSLSGDMALHFASSFTMDERVFIDYISHTPFKLINWVQTPQIQIPEFLLQSFVFGLTWLCSDMLFNRGDRNMQLVADRSKSQFDKELRAAVGYTRMLRDNSSTLQMRPVNWLPEE